MTSPATRAEEPTRLPKIDPADVGILTRIADDYAASEDLQMQAWAIHVREMDSLFRSLSTGSHKLVSRDELDAVRESLAVAETQVGHPTLRLIHKCVLRIDRWLADTQHEAER